MADEVIVDAVPVDAVVDPVVDPKPVDAVIDPIADPVIDPVADPVVDPVVDPVIDPVPDPVIDPVPIDPPKEVPPTDTEMVAKAVEVQAVYAKDYPWIVAEMDTVAVKVDEGSKKGAEYQRFFSYKPAHFSAEMSLVKAVESKDAKLIDAMTIMLKDTIAYIVEDLSRDRKVAVP